MNQKEFFSALFHPEAPIPQGLIGNQINQRFAVYRNNVITSLINALGDTFPVTKQLVGSAFFNAMAHNFVMEDPPTHPVLAHYGESFPNFITQFPPAVSLPYLPHMAQLEWLRLQVLHAADAQALSHQQMNQHLADAEQLVIQLHPACALFCSDYAVFSLWEAHQNEEGLRNLPHITLEQAQSVLIVRHQLSVLMHALHQGDDLFIEKIREGKTLGQATQAVIQQYPEYSPTAILHVLLRYSLIISATIHRESYATEHIHP